MEVGIDRAVQRYFDALKISKTRRGSPFAAQRLRYHFTILRAESDFLRG